MQTPCTIPTETYSQEAVELCNRMTPRPNPDLPVTGAPGIEFWIILAVVVVAVGVILFPGIGRGGD